MRCPILSLTLFSPFTLPREGWGGAAITLLPPSGGSGRGCSLLLNLLSVTASSLYCRGVEMFPLRQHVQVVLELRSRLRPCHAVAVVDGDEVLEEEGVDPRALIIGMNGYEHKLRRVLAPDFQ